MLVVSAPLAGIARATTPPTAETVIMDAIVRNSFSFIPEVSTIKCDLAKKEVQRDCEYNSS